MSKDEISKALLFYKRHKAQQLLKQNASSSRPVAKPAGEISQVIDLEDDDIPTSAQPATRPQQPSFRPYPPRAPTPGIAMRQSVANLNILAPRAATPLAKNVSTADMLHNVAIEQQYRPREMQSIPENMRRGTPGLQGQAVQNTYESASVPAAAHHRHAEAPSRPLPRQPAPAMNVELNNRPQSRSGTTRQPAQAINVEPTMGAQSRS
ncbi:hypothetical protein DFH27DRAFT_555146, partial [Peziza echinospora]